MHLIISFLISSISELYIDDHQAAVAEWPAAVQWPPRVRWLHLDVPERWLRRVCVRSGQRIGRRQVSTNCTHTNNLRSHNVDIDIATSGWLAGWLGNHAMSWMHESMNEPPRSRPIRQWIFEIRTTLNIISVQLCQQQWQHWLWLIVCDWAHLNIQSGWPVRHPTGTHILDNVMWEHNKHTPAMPTSMMRPAGANRPSESRFGMVYYDNESWLCAVMDWMQNDSGASDSIEHLISDAQSVALGMPYDCVSFTIWYSENDSHFWNRLCKKYIFLIWFIKQFENVEFIKIACSLFPK